MADLGFVLEYLHKVVELSNINERSDDSISDALNRMKEQAVADNDEQTAKLIWFYEKILDIQRNYLTAFSEMKLGQFYDAWCILERIEIDINSLARHYSQKNDDEYKLEFIEKHTRQFQRLFPYKYFFSPAFIQLEKKCSICGKIISIREPCGHLRGEIYHGEECIHEITKVELLELSIVTNPVQKYSVVFMGNSATNEKADHYDYSLVKYVIDGVQKPFDAWDVRWKKIRYPHSLFEHVAKDDKCPCGSGRSYRNCCLKTSGVLRPHVDILFNVAPPADLPRMVYPDYKKSEG